MFWGHYRYSVAPQDYTCRYDESDKTDTKDVVTPQKSRK